MSAVTWHAQLCDCCHSYLQPPSPPSRLRLLLLQMCNWVYVCVCMCLMWAKSSRTLRNCCCLTSVLFSWVSLSLSILRGRKPHVHRATNPLNMSPPPVNKKWPWILPRTAYEQDLAQSSQPISCRFPNSLGFTPSLPPKIQPINPRADLQNPTVHVNGICGQKSISFDSYSYPSPPRTASNPSSDLALGTYHFIPRYTVLLVIIRVCMGHHVTKSPEVITPETDTSWLLQSLNSVLTEWVLFMLSQSMGACPASICITSIWNRRINKPSHPLSS